MRWITGTSELILILILMVVSSSTAAEDEPKLIDENNVPPAVIDSFKTNFPDLNFEEIEKSETEGKKYYQFDCLQDDMEFDVVYLEDGTLYATKKEVEVDDLPTEVMDALGTAYPDADINEAEVVVRGDETDFEVELMVYEADEIMEYDVLVSSEGTIISTQAVDNEDEDEEEEDSVREDDGEE